MKKTKQEGLAQLALILVAIVWGSGFIATQYAIDANMGASLIMFGRFLVATILLFALFYKQIIKSNREEITKGCLAGVFLFLAFYAQTVGQSMTTVSNSAFLTATNVVIVPFLVWIITKKRPKLKVFLLTVTTLFGIAFLTVSFENGISFGVGDTIMLASAFFFALHIAYLGIACKDVDSRKITFWQIATAGLISLVVLLCFDINKIELVQIQNGILPVIFLGVFSTCLCFFVQTKAQTYIAPSKVGVILATEGLFGSIFSVILGFEHLTVNLIIGGVVIFLSIVLMDIKFAKTDKQNSH